MPTMMTVGEFKKLVMEMAQARTSLEAYSGYVEAKTRDDKYLREEYLPILALVNYKAFSEDCQIELGRESEPWDVRIGAADICEVVQALPRNEHEIRKGGQKTFNVDGQQVPIVFRGISSSADPHVYWEHAADHLQFPDVIAEAIESKHQKRYTDNRSLLVAFDGDYSFEEDEVIARWLKEIRKRTTQGTFREILLVERARLKVFPVF